MEMPVYVPVSNLKKHADPFGKDLWGCGAVRQKDVTRCLQDGTWRQAYLPKTRFRRFPGLGNKYEAARIAFFVMKPPSDAIEVDVGCPGLGCEGHWMVTDGNHRLAAAIYSKAPFILASVAGDMDFAQYLLGVDCLEPDHRKNAA